MNTQDTHGWPQSGLVHIETGDSFAAAHGGGVARIEPVRTAYEMLEALDIRKKVFVDEQKVDMAEEYDGLDRHALHALAYVDGRAVGTLRLLRDGDTGKSAASPSPRVPRTRRGESPARLGHSPFRPH